MTNFIDLGRSRVRETVGTTLPPLPLSPPSQSQKYNSQIQMGVVHQVIAGTYFYRIAFAGFTTPALCTSTSPYSVLQPVVSDTYPVGSRVLVLLNHEFTYGYILGPAPVAYTPDLDQSITTANLISSIGTYHYKWSRYLEHFLGNNPLAEGLSDYAYHRIVDQFQGDYTISNALGGGLHIDPFMLFLRQSHSCGIWMFMADQLLRLMGTSIQEYSAVHERYAGVDEGESYYFEGMALYPWEGLGLLLPEGQLHKKYEPRELLERKGIGFAEPAEERTPFYRQQKFSGFVGQGQVALQFVPPKSRDLAEHPIAVSREQSLMDGTLLLESAKGIHLVKHGNIRSFKRQRAIDDPAGDDLKNKNYEFSKTPPPAALRKDASITDQILHAVRKQANVGFEGHQRDFLATPQEQQAFEKDVNLADLAALRTKPTLADAPQQLLFVDERYGEEEYSGSRASISLLSGGGIAIRGGCGEEILLQGGNVTVSAPGDFRCLFGRSAVTLAGDDIILRAKNSADITATDHDVRIKAERNLDMVGGMGGVGRTLLENKARGLPHLEGVQDKEGEAIAGAGVVVRANDSAVASYGKRIYTRCLEHGEIFLDADNGKGSIKTRAGYVGLHASQNIALGITDGTKESVMNLLQLNRTSTALTTRLQVDGSIYVSQVVRADMGCNKDPIAPPNFDEVIETTDGRQMTLREIMDAYKESFVESNMERPNALYYDEQGLGSDGMVQDNTFSYRTSQQCGASRFSFEELYWMELFGTTVITTFATWNEPVYLYQKSIEQTAWPGYEKWVKDPCVEPGKTRLYDAASGLDGDRMAAGSVSPSKVTPEEFYRVVDPT